jgi:hypothetical protein
MNDKNNVIFQVIKAIFEKKTRIILFVFFLLSFMFYDYLAPKYSEPIPVWVDIIGITGFGGITWFLGINIIRFFPRNGRYYTIYVIASIIMIFIGVMPLVALLMKLI